MSHLEARWSVDGQALGLYLRVFLAAVFLISGSTKLRLRGSTQLRMLEAVGVSMSSGVRNMARVLPWGELCLAMCLLGPWGLSALVVATILLICLSALMVIAFCKGYRGTCGCFGESGNLGVSHLVLNSMLVVSSIVAAVYESYESVTLSILDLELPNLLRILPVYILLPGIYLMLRQMESLLRQK